MANSIFAFPNWSDEAAAVFHGGDWTTASPLEKMAADDINDPAISTDATEASTQFELDLGAARDLRLIAFVETNIEVNGQRRVRATNTAAFGAATVNGVNTAGASSVSFAAGASDLDIDTGDRFTIAGDSTVYEVTGDTTISASSTGSVSITPNLVVTTAGGEVITCRSGDYSSPEYDDGAMTDVYGIIYPWGTLPLFHPSWFTGKPAQRDIDEGRFPLVIIFPSTIFARYIKVEISDTSNADGQIEIGRLFVARGTQPTYNLAYGGTNIGWLTETSVEKTLSGRRIYNEKPMRRLLPLEIQNLPKNEALTTFFDMQQKLNKNKQLFFVFDPDATQLMHRTAFPATLADLDPIQFPYFGVNNIGMQLIEVI